MRDSSRVGVVVSIVLLVLAIVFLVPGAGIGSHIHWHGGHFSRMLPWILLAMVFLLISRRGCCRRGCGKRKEEDEATED